MVILRTRNKITDFLMILAWASPFKPKKSFLPWKGAKSYGILDVGLLNTCSNQEQSDTLLIFHTLHVFQIGGEITIMTSDTDVFNYCPAQN